MVICIAAPRIKLLNDPRATHGLNDVLCDQQLERDRVFEIVASIANLLDKPMFVETMKSVLGVEPIEVEDCVLFDDLTIKFGDDGRVIGLYRTLDGTTEPAKSVIQNLSDNGCAT